MTRQQLRQLVSRSAPQREMIWALVKLRMQGLTDRWEGFVARVGVFPERAEAVFSVISEAYATPLRAYHNLDHVKACLELLDEVFDAVIPAIELAIWFHDAVYEPLSTTNERDSALLMSRAVARLGMPDHVTHDAERLILTTARHETASRPDELTMADIDLAILAADPVSYDLYAAAIRTEYAMVGDDAYRQGRTAFLERLLAAPRLFRTPWAADRGFEERARANIRRERAALSS